MFNLFLTNTVWYVGQIIFIFAVCLMVTIIVVAFLASIKLCIQLCGLCNTLVLSPSIYLYDRSKQLYKYYNEEMRLPLLEVDDI
uniref:Envelope small membrane protein n=1 Tax=Murine hepatitis virus TaxID=11138 RepID=A0A2D1CEE9_9BETC|nr:envelope protein [Murine hepatitis virus]